MRKPLPYAYATGQDVPADVAPGPASAGPGWSRPRKLATLALLAAASWAAMGALALGLVKLAQWEAAAGLVRWVGVI